MSQINFRLSEEKKMQFAISLAISGKSITEVLNGAIDNFINENNINNASIKNIKGNNKHG